MRRPDQTDPFPGPNGSGPSPVLIAALAGMAPSICGTLVAVSP